MADDDDVVGPEVDAVNVTSDIAEPSTRETVTLALEALDENGDDVDFTQDDVTIVLSVVSFSSTILIFDAVGK